tara:strand:- start:485 stop:694 length:210 start_codon:yes stop_codon:yes gene_type:complete
MNYDTRHGGPYDRGTADFWYGRPFEPHFFKGATHSSDKVELSKMSAEQITQYTAGFREAEADGSQKDWG